MFKDGLHLSHGIDNHALVVIRKENGMVLWVREFAGVEFALNVLEDEVLAGHDRSAIESALAGKRGFFTEDFVEPEGGFSGHAFQRYVLSHAS